MSDKRILIVGGTGAFGARLSDGAAASLDATVIVAARNLEACERLAADLRARHPGKSVEAARIDRSSADPETIEALAPDIVVDAAGPFQGGDLRFAHAVIAAGRTYLDLADARDFVGGFSVLDAEAREKGVLAITGASSTPALSNAAIDVLTAGWRSVERVEIAISPGNRAPRGLSVVTAILSYAGRPVTVLIDGRRETRPGWGMLARRRMPALGSRFQSLCETPDLDLVPARFPAAKTVLFRAGLELAPLHLGLWLASLPVRLGLLRSLAPAAPAMRAAAELFERFGSDRGGMTVDVEGLDAGGRRARARWSLIAEAGDGPFIPTLPALAFIRATLDERPPAPAGAHVAAGLLDLAAFDREALRHAIRTCIDHGGPDGRGLFRRALGPDFDHLPPEARRAHDPSPMVEMSGTADIDGAGTPVGRAVAKLFGFPREARNVPARVRIEAAGGDELWTRTFGASTFSSRLSASGAPGELIERFGLFAFDLAVAPEADGFSLAVEGWRAFGVPLPRAFAPSTSARGFADAEGVYGFDVTISLPLVGRLVRYRGRLSEKGLA